MLCARCLVNWGLGSYVYGNILNILVNSTLDHTMNCGENSLDIGKIELP